MVKNFIIVKVDSNYCNYLRSYDSKVMYNDGAKDLRPFIGVLFAVNGFEYFVPLASPKAKHSTIQNKIDIVKIDDGKSIYEKKRQNLLKSQLLWLNKNKINLRKQAYNLYNLYTKNKLPQNVMNRCCNFTLLEEKCSQFNI